MLIPQLVYQTAANMLEDMLPLTSISGSPLCVQTKNLKERREPGEVHYVRIGFSALTVWKNLPEQAATKTWLHECSRAHIKLWHVTPKLVWESLLSLSTQPANLSYSLSFWGGLDWISRHADLHAIYTIGTIKLTRNHRLSSRRISCYLWLDWLICGARGKTLPPSVFCR